MNLPDDNTNQPQKPASIDPTPPVQPAEDGSVALRAALGFLTYLAVGALSIGSLFGLIALIVLLIVAGRFAMNRQHRGFALGVLIGLGLTLLALGICFVAFSRSSFR